MTITDNPHIIGKDDYFSREQPEKSEELANSIEVTTQPLKPEAAISTLYTSKDLITLDAGGSYPLIAKYNSPPALTTGATSSLIDATGGTLTILSATFYPWGAEVIVENNDTSQGSARVKLEGYALSVQGKETIVADDSTSILDNGLQKYVYPDNHLIQSPSMAQKIADNLLASYKQYRKDVTVNWRGNPALELADTILVTTYERGSTKVEETFKVFRNQIEFDGALRQNTDGRKI